MTPLGNFEKSIILLSIRPFDFLKENEQREFIIFCSDAVSKLKSALENKDLKNTHAYKILLLLEKDVREQSVSEVNFLQHFGNLLEVYRLSLSNKDLMEQIDNLESILIKIKPKILEYHLVEESLKKKVKKLSEEEQKRKDLDHLQKVGIFYVLEYTLQVLLEFQTLPDENRNKLLDFGLQTSVGNLPAYVPLEETFRKELCNKIYDDNLRRRLLEAFYSWEEVLYNPKRDLKHIILALKQFNLAVLSSFNQFGFIKFKAAIYAPFGNNLLIKDLIKKIEAI